MPTGRMKAPRCNWRDPIIPAAPRVVDKAAPRVDAGVVLDQISTKLPLSLRGAHRATKQSGAGESRWSRDCFAEPVLGRRTAPTRGLENDSWNWWCSLSEICSEVRMAKKTPPVRPGA